MLLGVYGVLWCFNRVCWVWWLCLPDRSGNRARGQTYDSTTEGSWGENDTKKGDS